MAGTLGFRTSEIGALALRLELGEIRKKDEDKGSGWEIDATAIVSQDDRPRVGIAIQFYLDDKTYENTEDSEDDGRTQKTITIQKPGGHKIGVQIANTTKSVNKRVTIKEDESGKGAAKGAASIDCQKEFDGHDCYNISFTVLNGEGKGVKDAVIRISDRTHEGGFFNLPKTDASGVSTTTTSCTPVRDTIIARVLGTPVHLRVFVPNQTQKGSE